MPVDQETLEIRKGQLQNFMSRGMECITEIWLWAYNIPEGQREDFLYGLTTVVLPLRMGLMGKAATLLQAISNIPALDTPYDSSNPGGETVRQHFHAFITERIG